MNKQMIQKNPEPISYAFLIMFHPRPASYSTYLENIIAFTYFENQNYREK